MNQRRDAPAASTAQADRLIEEHGSVVLAVLKRGEERGEDLGEPEIAREAGLDATQVSPLLKRLEHDGQALETASGSWRLTPAASTKVEAKPHPSEPAQDESG